MKHKLSFCSFLILMLCCIDSRAQIISTIAGTGTPGYSGDGGPAVSATFNFPFGIAIDNARNIYIADHENNVIRKINSAGVVSTFAGTGAVGYSGDGGPATAANLNGPNSVTIDIAGNIYFSDFHNNVVRKVNTAGIITTVVGNGTGGYSGDGGPATSAGLSPYGIAIDHNNNLFIADIFNSVVRKVNSAGIISTMAGTGTVGYSGDGGPATAAQLNYVYGIAVDNSGLVYVVDYGNNVIRQIDCSNIIHTIAGNGMRGYSGDGGPATSAQLNPQGIAVDGGGNLYIADHGSHIVRKVNSLGVISTAAGNGTPGYSGDGGLATAAQLADLYGLAADQAGNLYICDNFYSVVRMVTATIPPPLQLQPLPKDSTICSGGKIDFSVNAGSEYNYQWQYNDGSGWTDVTNDNNYSGASTNNLSLFGVPPNFNGYQYRCVISNTCGFLLQSSPSSLTVTPPTSTPNVSISSSANPVCAGTMVTFTAVPTNGGPEPEYQWKLNGMDVGGTSHTFSSDSLRDGDVVSCVMKSSLLCTFPSTVSSNNVLVQLVKINTGVNIASSATATCSGNLVTFMATPFNGGSNPAYQWQVNGINVGSNSNEYASESFKNGDVVNCVMSSSVACATPVSSLSPVTLTVAPSPQIFMASDTIIAGGNSIQLDPSITGTIATYQWSPPDGLDDPNIPDPIAHPSRTTTYELDVVADNGCPGKGKITVALFYGLQMPNAFTPNGDGKNDVFRIPPSVPLKVRRFAIFNRWGEKVFETSNPANGWDGTLNNQPQPSSTYVWMIEFYDVLTRNYTTQSGTVTLIR